MAMGAVALQTDSDRWVISEGWDWSWVYNHSQMGHKTTPNPLFGHF